jgi:hypothetical protein
LDFTLARLRMPRQAAPPPALPAPPPAAFSTPSAQTLILPVGSKRNRVPTKKALENAAAAKALATGRVAKDSAAKRSPYLRVTYKNYPHNLAMDTRVNVIVRNWLGGRKHRSEEIVRTVAHAIKQYNMEVADAAEKSREPNVKMESVERK